MFIFRTILLWLAFLLLLIQQYWQYSGETYLAIIFRLFPSVLLLIWFLLSIIFSRNESVKLDNLSKTKKQLIKISRHLASLVIIAGAVFKIMHLSGGNLLLIIGIGCMAVYSSLITIYGHFTSNKQNDLLDNFDDLK